MMLLWRWKLLRPLSSLCFGFFVGQGLTFLTHAYFIRAGHADLVGEISVGIGIVVLLQWFADFGGLTLLSGRHRNRRFVMSAIVARLTIAIVAVVLGGHIAHSWLTTPLAQGIVDMGRFAAIPWALNLTGYLDGLGRSGRAGVTSTLCWLLCNSATVIVLPATDMQAGRMIGGAFCLGAALTVCHQYSLIHDRLLFRRPSLKLLKAYFFLALGCSLTQMAGIAYAKLLLVVVYQVSNPSDVGAFSLARSGVSCVQQVVAFVRRLEFPRLVNSSKRTSLRTTFALQASSLACSIVLAIVALAVLVAPSSFVPAEQQALDLLCCFTMLLPLWCCATCIGQQLLADRYTWLTLATTICLSAGSLIITSKLIEQGISYVVLSEALMYLCMLAAYLVMYRTCYPSK